MYGFNLAPREVFSTCPEKNVDANRTRSLSFECVTLPYANCAARRRQWTPKPQTFNTATRAREGVAKPMLKPDRRMKVSAQKKQVFPVELHGTPHDWHPTMKERRCRSRKLPPMTILFCKAAPLWTTEVAFITYGNRSRDVRRRQSLDIQTHSILTPFLPLTHRDASAKKRGEAMLKPQSDESFGALANNSNAVVDHGSHPHCVAFERIFMGGKMEAARKRYNTSACMHLSLAARAYANVCPPEESGCRRDEATSAAKKSQRNKCKHKYGLRYVHYPMQTVQPDDACGYPKPQTFKCKAAPLWTMEVAFITYGNRSRDVRRRQSLNIQTHSILTPFLPLTHRDASAKKRGEAMLKLESQMKVSAQIIGRTSLYILLTSAAYRYAETPLLGKSNFMGEDRGVCSWLPDRMLASACREESGWRRLATRRIYSKTKVSTKQMQVSIAYSAVKERCPRVWNSSTRPHPLTCEEGHREETGGSTPPGGYGFRGGNVFCSGISMVCDMYTTLCKLCSQTTPVDTPKPQTFNILTPFLPLTHRDASAKKRGEAMLKPQSDESFGALANNRSNLAVLLTSAASRYAETPL
ncbi:hypothetical protein GGX14DRAFT_392247 [Mycena pura]|uniref:Uncharacterized protein n=1 Tax=Mycena pura TaxID=153505 RepID=A0AAD6YJD0_9AGAR|nr:hypothetical protein GGX14DRAFT_392247 [Mycena pura]